MDTVAARLGVAVETLEESLLADLPGERIVRPPETVPSCQEAIVGTGTELITSARPMIGRPSGWSPKTAPASTSWTLSEGSSSYIAISSITTWRSESMSGYAGRSTMSWRTSKARSRWPSRKRE